MSQYIHDNGNLDLSNYTDVSYRGTGYINKLDVRADPFLKGIPPSVRVIKTCDVWELGAGKSRTRKPSKKEMLEVAIVNGGKAKTQVNKEDGQDGTVKPLSKRDFHRLLHFVNQHDGMKMTEIAREFECTYKSAQNWVRVMTDGEMLVVVGKAENKERETHNNYKQAVLDLTPLAWNILEQEAHLWGVDMQEILNG